MIGLLLWLLIFALVIYVAYLVVGLMPLPPVARQIVVLILAVIFLLALLRRLGFAVI